MFKRFQKSLFLLTLASGLGFGSTIISPPSTGGGGGSDPNKWDLAGNTGTDPASNFLGSADAQDIVLKANSSERFKLLSGSTASRITGTLQFKGSTNSNTAGFIAPALSGSYSLTLPSALPGSTLPTLSDSAGLLSFGQIDLTTMVTGVLPSANGGVPQALGTTSTPTFNQGTINVAPSVPTSIATKAYVDSVAGGVGTTYSADGLGLELSGNTFSLELADTSLTKSASGVAVDWTVNPYKGQYFVDAFSGDNSTVAFTMSQDPISKNNTLVYVSGVYQAKANYSVSGTTLTFTTAPPTGTANVEIVVNKPLAATVVGANSIGTIELQDDAVYTANILDSAVTSAKILDGTIVAADLATSSVTTAKILDGTILAADLASDSVTTAKIVDANVTTAKIADDNVTTAKILNANVTSAKLAADAVTSAKILDGTIATADLADSSITSAKILDGTITSDDLAAGAVTISALPTFNYVVSSSSNIFSSTSSSYTDVTNLSVSITTVGRPVQIYMVPESSSVGARINHVSGGTSNIKVLRGATAVGTDSYSGVGAEPCGVVMREDQPAAGTYTYKVQVQSDGTNAFVVTKCRLVAREL